MPHSRLLRMRGPGPLRVLLVDDDPDDAALTIRDLRSSGAFEVVHVRLPSEAMSQVERSHFDVCLLDYRLPELSGVALCKRLRLAGFAGLVVLLTSVHDEAVAQAAAAAGADDFMTKSPDQPAQVGPRLLSRLGAPAHAAR